MAIRPLTANVHVDFSSLGGSDTNVNLLSVPGLYAFISSTPFQACLSAIR